MSLLVLGISHRTASADLLDRVAVPPSDTPALLRALLEQTHIGEAVVLSTCNRVEIYAGVSHFHPALAEITGVLGDLTGVDAGTLARHLYVRGGDEAVRHLYRVAAGLDSMVVGEAQILGQLRDAYARAAEYGAVGRTGHQLMQQALRVGKRVRATTGINTAGRDMVTAALHLGQARAGVPIEGASALVVGAGAMGGLALAALRRAGATRLIVANRSAARAHRLAAHHAATAISMGCGRQALRHVDIVVSATSSATPVFTAADLPADRTKPLLILDLAVPRDVDAAAADAPGVTLVDIASMRDALPGTTGTDVAAAEAMVAEEAGAFLSRLRGRAIAPTVAALRTRGDEVVASELAALRRRRPDLSHEQRADVARTMHRIAQRLLHQPTVRARQLAAGPGGDRYETLVRELFDLHPTARQPG
ncbi:MAG TPA: glutamyl-tRNA reductase [Actinoplanes sp.]|nr:glutamyl-tRNA reductase [Actinoplanes sp.]